MNATLPALIALLAALAPQEEKPVPRKAQGGDKQSLSAIQSTFRTLTREMKDGVVLTADWYPALSLRDPALDLPPAPVVVCFHMARSSRGEYRDIAPELLREGFSVLAVDLRCGAERFDVENATAKSFRAQYGRDATYADAYSDFHTAVTWAKELASDAPVVLMGSSYSASLVLVYASHARGQVAKVLAFSPGEYLPTMKIAEEAKRIELPTYITCGRGPRELEQARPIAEAIPREHLTTVWPVDGSVVDHGSRTLAVGSVPDREKNWEPVKRFLREGLKLVAK